MITRLEIHNIALISHLCIDFDKGMTVLSGETGSGKSIIIDALSFVLGERADKSLIKHGQDRASVEVVFAVQSNNTCAVMQMLGIEHDGTIVINRTMTLAGKNDCRINGRNCTTAMLRQLTSTLVDIFGQSQHYNMLKVDKHIGIIDGFSDFGSLMVDMKSLHKQYRDINKQLTQFGGSQGERDRQLDILSFQIQELTNANLSVDEEEELSALHQRMVNTEKIVGALSTANQYMSNGEMSISNIMGAVISTLSGVSRYDSHLADLATRLDCLRIETIDVADDIHSQLLDCEYDTKEVDRVELRLDTLRSIKRKYGGSVQSAMGFLSEATKQHDILSNATQLIDQLTISRQDIVAQMYALCAKISTIRQATATKFANDIQNELSLLGMKGTTFEVQFAPAPTIEQYCNNVTANGYDSVEFMLSANVGEPLKPLAKVISGGEMSRFMLAIKNITATIENISTMVFDEIDTGISGNIAQMVAKKLYNVSHLYQCIVITHLPQIVAMADNNLLISKTEQEGKTISSLDILRDLDSKSQEVARLMGGIGQHATVNAIEMIKWCEQYKQSQ